MTGLHQPGDRHLDFSRAGKPTDNAFVESFNGRFRDECLNMRWYLNSADAKGKIEAWRRDFNETGPHTSLGLTPADEAPESSFCLDVNPEQGQDVKSRIEIQHWGSSPARR